MKIATFNINGVRARLQRLVEWLREAQPDVVCLQELKAPAEAFPQADIRAAGYEAVWHGQKSWNGVAILARGEAPVERRRVLPGDPEDLHSRYIEAQVKGLVVTLSVMHLQCTHCTRRAAEPRCSVWTEAGSTPWFIATCSAWPMKPSVPAR